MKLKITEEQFKIVVNFLKEEIIDGSGRDPWKYKNEGDSSTTISDIPLSVKRLEWEHVQRVLMQHEGNISAAARALNMHRRSLQRKLEKRPVRD